MEDFKRKIDATKQWVALKAKDLETLTFIRAKLGELYDKMLENQMRMNQNDMQKMRAHVVCILFASLPEYMHKAAKKYTDRSKNKEDSDKKTMTKIFQQSKSKVKGNMVRFSSPSASADENKFQDIATRRKDIFYERTIQLAAASFGQPRLKIKAVKKFREIYDKPPQLQPPHTLQQKQPVAARQQEQQPQQCKPRDTYMNLRNLRRYLRKQYLRGTVDGAFTEVSDNELMWALISAYDLLRSLCHRAIQNHLIDVGTMNFILQPLRDLGFPNPSKASLPAVLSCLGKIRYFVKLHKPGCKLRRVEVDTRSPFNNLTIFVSSILRKVVCICETTVMDSKQVLLDLLDHPPPLGHDTRQLVFVAADLEDFYPRINLDSLQVSLCSGLDNYLGVNQAAKDFVAKLVLIILHNKAVFINGKVYKKARSLSIGERIAIDAANIHREHHFRPLVSQAFETGLLSKYYGYVDDTASIFPGNQATVQSFVLSALQRIDTEQFKWTFKVSFSRLDFLDLSIRYDGEQLHTFVHRKPQHNPQLFRQTYRYNFVPG
eukprot:s2784_g1.t1